jgi:hypothetical protein
MATKVSTASTSSGMTGSSRVNKRLRLATRTTKTVDCWGAITVAMASSYLDRRIRGSV